jgi:hypothetical protein
MFQPGLRCRREKIGVVQRSGGDVDSRRARRILIQELAAARAAKLACDSLRGAVDARATRQDFNLAAVKG